MTRHLTSLPRPGRSQRAGFRRLWPLLSLPLLGAVLGPFIIPHLDKSRWAMIGAGAANEAVVDAAYGLFAGNALMIVAAMLVAGYRVARMRFTLRTILIVIALCAIGLTLARAILF